MTTLEAVREGWREVAAHKFRSFLTVLGVVLGVACLLAMFALTAGFAAGAKEFLNALGGVEVLRMDDKDPPPHQQPIKEISRGLTRWDAQAIRRHAPLIDFASPEVDDWGRTQYENREADTRIVGAEPDHLHTELHVVARGRFISDLDLQRAAPVCVIGYSIARTLFPDPAEDPLGRTIRVRGVSLRVIGIFDRYETDSQRRARDAAESRGETVPEDTNRWNPLNRKNMALVMPLTTFQTQFRSTTLVNGVDAGPNPRVDRISLKVRNAALIDPALAQVHEIVLREHRGIEDFGFNTRESWSEWGDRAARAARMSGLLLAGISLFVGGLGICNIMLASISERIREIGVRRAIGATARSVFFQIIVEAAVLAALGGAAGLVAAMGLIQILVWVSPPQNAPIVEWSAAGISFGFAVLTGVLAGIYPAFKAAALSPIEALRYE